MRIPEIPTTQRHRFSTVVKWAHARSGNRVHSNHESYESEGNRAVWVLPGNFAVTAGRNNHPIIQPFVFIREIRVIRG
jgi:hypothetical protein